jgi:hypothetical protein
MSTPKANAICWAIRVQPQVGLRRFISMTASINSWAGRAVKKLDLLESMMVAGWPHCPGKSIPKRSNTTLHGQFHA